MRFISLAAFALATLISTAAVADDWTATKLRGAVLTLVDGDWVKLARGDVVSDDRVIRTLKGGRVSFRRGAETIDLGGNTQVQIIDRTGRKFTTVKQYFGSVAVEAEVQQVQHFAVQTPHLAAVVKGTRFVVVSGKRGAKVEVQRGRVAVEDRDTHQSTLVAAGQSVSTADGAPLAVSGRGDLPAVFGPNGKPIEVAKGTRRGGNIAAAAEEARAAAIAAGASPKEAEKAAKEAAKEAKEEAKEAAKDAKEEAKEAAKEAKSEAKDEAKEAKSEAKSSGTSDDSNGNSGSGGSNSGGSSNGGSDSSGNGNSGGENSGNGKGGKKDKD